MKIKKVLLKAYRVGLTINYSLYEKEKFVQNRRKVKSSSIIN